MDLEFAIVAIIHCASQALRVQSKILQAISVD